MTTVVSFPISPVSGRVCACRKLPCCNLCAFTVDLIFQHGKDFEAIQNNIALKYKKKGKPASMVKNKEQVRHFYYRTWHKITKYIDFDNGECARPRLPAAQELVPTSPPDIAVAPLSPSHVARDLCASWHLGCWYAQAPLIKLNGEEAAWVLTDPGAWAFGCLGV